MKNSRYVARSTAIAARALGDETMVMSAANSTLFTLNEIASVIWAAADGVTPLEQIVANKICTQYDIAPELALKDAETLVEELARHGILLVSDQPLAKPANSRGETP
jgi:Coenzyme PQQ synthesis protein D (PqqD)